VGGAEQICRRGRAEHDDEGRDAERGADLPEAVRDGPARRRIARTSGNGSLRSEGGAKPWRRIIEANALSAWPTASSSR
jgi:hypothetical protein